MDAQAPRRLGRYQLLSRLGSGGMGDVYRARAHGAEGVAKELCLKLIREPRLGRADALARFVREARLWVRLQHGAIVAVFDFGRSGEDYYLAMEWVDGADAGSLLRAGPLPEPVAAHVAAEVARALDYAHGEGLVHCDVKPANVLLSRSGDVKLADFGLARVVGAAGGRGGTPGYAAPEQRGGADVDARADLYALGALLAALATGERDPAGLESPELRTLATRLTAEDREDRPRTAAEVANALEGFTARDRAAGGAAPREILAERARAATPRGTATTEALEGTESLLALDGDSMRTTASAPSVPDAPPGRPAPRWGRAALVLAAAVAVAGALVWGIGSPTGGEPGRAPRDGETGAPAVPAATSAPRAPPVRTTPTEVVPAEADPAPPEEAPPEPETPEPEPAPAPGRAPRAAARTARLSVNAVPWARVTLDGRDVGVTPLLELPVRPGPHRVELHNPALGARITRRVTLRADGHERLIVRLRPEGDESLTDPPAGAPAP